MPGPDEAVVIHGGLWDAVAEGLVGSEDLSPSLRLRESFSATLPARVRAPLQPLPRNWRGEWAHLRAVTPFGRQTPVRPSPPPSGPSSPGASRSSENSENVEINLLRAELAAVECARAAEKDAARTRERALFKVLEGFVEYNRALR